MVTKFYNINVHSYYSILKSNLSIQAIIKHALDNQQSHVVLTDTSLFGAIAFYRAAIKNHLKPIIGLDFTYKNNQYLLFAINNLGYHNLIKIHSLQNLNILELTDALLEHLIVVHLQGSDPIKTKHYFAKDTCAINEVKMASEQDANLIRVLHAIKQEQPLNAVNLTFNHNWFLNDQEAAEVFTSEQIANNQRIIETCNWVINERTVKLAKYPIPQNVTTKKYLQDLCSQGLKNIFGNSGIMPKIYIERLIYELDIIDKMGYNDYFLIVADFVNHGKKQNIMIGPGRGSAAGSLVAYALGITMVDPIKYNLIFERFLNPSRTTLPDIDIDVMDTRRQEIIDYIFDKYHPDNTSYIITFQHMKAKMAIRDVGRVLNVPLPVIDRITKLLPYELEDNLLKCKDYAPLSQLYIEFEQLFLLANQLIGIPRQISTHAAGIIIADKPLYEYIPVQLGIDNWHLSQFTMDYLEDLGIFKIDILGLKNLSIISDVLDLIWRTKAQKIDINNLNLEDANVFKDIANASTIGIFQLESPGMRNTLRKIKPKCIEDISITSALFRPGPQAFINDYVKTRENQIPINYVHPSIEPVLASTLGFCIYQEQVIELVKVVTGFSNAEADIFRRAISKKDEKMFATMKTSFLDSAQANKFPLEDAKAIFEYIITFANYGFNHSHSLAYSFVSYQMAYLKHYFPLEFIVTLLKYGDSSNIKNNLYITEAKQRNIKIHNVSISHSKINFDLYNDGIIFGFINIKGLGIEIAKRIYQAQQEYQFKTWDQVVGILGRLEGVGTKAIELLVKVGAFEEFNVDRNFILANLNEVISKTNINRLDTKMPVFDIAITNDYVAMTEQEKAEWEFKLLSFTFSDNKWTSLFEKYQTKYKLIDFDASKITSDKSYLVKLNNIKKTMTKFGKPMAFLEFSSDGADFNCVSFSEAIFANLTPNKYHVCKFKLSAEQKVQLHFHVTELSD